MGLRHSRLLWLLIGLAAATALYALVGFVLVPKLVRYEAEKFVRDEYGKRLQLGEVRFHPFRLWLELTNVALPDRDGKLLLGTGRLFVDYQLLSSIWERAFVFREVTVVEPIVRAVVRKNGRINLADLAGKPKPREEQDEELPSLWVQDLIVENGVLDFVDHARPTSFSRRIQPLSFSLRDFRTTPHGGDFRVAATLGSRGQGRAARATEPATLGFRGNVTFTPEVASRGRIKVKNLPAATVAEYLTEVLPFGIPRGSLHLDAAYHFKLGEQTRTQVNVSQLSLIDVALRARGAAESWVKLPKIEVTNATGDLERKQLQVAKIQITDAHVSAAREADGSINLQQLFTPTTGPKPSASAPARAAVESLDATANSASNPRAGATWTVQLSELLLRHASVDFEDRAVTGGARGTLRNIEASVEHASLDLKRPVALKFQAEVNDDQGLLKARGDVTPQPLNADLMVQVDDVELSLAQPYVAEQAALTLRDGSLSAEGKLQLAAPGGQAPALAYEGGMTIDDFKTIDDAQRQDLVNFKRLEVKQAKFTANPDLIEVEKIVITEPYAKLVLSPKQVLNVTEVLAAPSRVAAGSADERAAPTTDERSAATPAEPMPVLVKTVFINDMRLNFSDFYVQPNFAAEIQGLTGKLKNLSSQPKSRADLHLEGHLGETSPVVISGKTQPFAYDKFSDLSIQCSNIALPVFNPYSGRFAGYNIERGELTTDLHYQLQNRKLDASHHIRIDQLTWGEKTPTKEKAPLPVKLATALLRDREGVINLDVPVNGTLDDPKFRVWPIIWQVFKNVIVKAVTAPFDMLGSLFKGAEKARYVDFAPGKAELSATAREGLASLGKALSERPQLTLDVPVGTVNELDRKALADQNFEERLQRSVAETLSRRERREGVAEFDALDEEQKLAALEKLYEDLTGSKPELKDAPKAKQGASRREAKEHAREYQVGQLEASARAKVQVEAAQLEALGKRRGEAIESELLKAAKIDGSRVLLTSKGKVSAQQQQVRYELELK
jgi:hypothetical protein